MKVTKPPQWFDWAPAWEAREVRKHYAPEQKTLKSGYLDKPLPIEEARQRRRDKEPLEYILKHCHVGPITVKTDDRALIPRPETETLLRRFESSLSGIPTGPIIDCGTGTGIIAAWLSEQTRRWVVATERFSKPLSLAKENRDRHDYDYELIQTDRLNGISGSFAAILANLPYVFPGSETLKTSVRYFEPAEALFMPSDPTDFYQGMIDQVSQLLKPEGEAWFEGSERLFRRLKKEIFPHQTSTIESTVLRDESDRERFLRLKKRR
jgi:release factor glutamine methyltransferase